MSEPICATQTDNMVSQAIDRIKGVLDGTRPLTSLNPAE